MSNTTSKTIIKVPRKSNLKKALLKAAKIIAVVGAITAAGTITHKISSNNKKRAFREKEEQIKWFQKPHDVISKEQFIHQNFFRGKDEPMPYPERPKSFDQYMKEMNEKTYNLLS